MKKHFKRILMFLLLLVFFNNSQLPYQSKVETSKKTVESELQEKIEKIDEIEKIDKYPFNLFIQKIKKDFNLKDNKVEIGLILDKIEKTDFKIKYVSEEKNTKNVKVLQKGYNGYKVCERITT